MAITYAKFYYNHRVDGDFIAWLDTKADPPDKWELVSILPVGSPFVGGQRGGHTGEIAMQCACYFKRTE